MPIHIIVFEPTPYTVCFPFKFHAHFLPFKTTIPERYWEGYINFLHQKHWRTCLKKSLDNKALPVKMGAKKICNVCSVDITMRQTSVQWWPFPNRPIVFSLKFEYKNCFSNGFCKSGVVDGPEYSPPNWPIAASVITETRSVSPRCVTFVPRDIIKDIMLLKRQGLRQLYLLTNNFIIGWKRTC